MPTLMPMPMLICIVSEDYRQQLGPLPMRMVITMRVTTGLVSPVLATASCHKMPGCTQMVKAMAMSAMRNHMPECMPVLVQTTTAIAAAMAMGKYCADRGGDRHLVVLVVVAAVLGSGMWGSSWAIWAGVTKEAS